jgi:anti-sigma regulatory factor (Ser/Thr protein kinase)
VRSRRRQQQPLLVLRAPSRTEFLAAIRDVSKRVAELAGCTETIAAQVALAVEEAATNVIEHAYGGASDREIELAFDCRPGELEVEILDDGRPVDRRAVPRVDLGRYARERRRGGLGVHLMGRIMDDVSFARRGRRNVCRMLKKLKATETREAP